ncbi:MAG: carbonic anhydrase [Polyangiaceae bacterium UTPRO1]|jgi:carbonic anhydrase|nr:carbonic anhydrase [Myxococcales bacterium]OQY66811.1 MAG: carbonic anhydrase [Polyangiaceae bacterium UTPRO1]
MDQTQPIQDLFANNRRWVAAMTQTDPEFFRKRARPAEPHFLFIGCSDSRVPADQLTGTTPGELFVHRNIANQVFTSDLNMLSVLQYAVEILKVENVIVCGHYGCAGVQAAADTAPLGLVDNWLGNIRNVMRLHRGELEAITDPAARLRRLVDLNVIEQVYNLSQTPVAQRAWRRGARLLLHGLVYELEEGLLKALALGIDAPEKAEALAHSNHHG